jgi:predicted RNA-binding protein YlqC (UPF0109 family)
MYAELVRYIVSSLVDNPDAVQATESEYRGIVTVELSVGDGDMGRVIGRRGRVINSIRSIVQVSAAKQGKRANVEVLED